jgi:hypothetical protein
MPLFDTLVMFDHEALDASMRRLRPDWQSRSFELREQTSYPVTLYAYAEPTLMLRLAWRPSRLSRAQAGRLLQHLKNLLLAMARDPGARLRQLPMLSVEELQRL